MAEVVKSNISLSVALLAEDDDAAAAELDNSLRFVVRDGEDSFPNLSDKFAITSSETLAPSGTLTEPLSPSLQLSLTRGISKGVGLLLQFLFHLKKNGNITFSFSCHYFDDNK